MMSFSNQGILSQAIALNILSCLELKPHTSICTCMHKSEMKYTKIINNGYTVELWATLNILFINFICIVFNNKLKNDPNQTPAEYELLEAGAFHWLLLWLLLSCSSAQCLALSRYSICVAWTRYE